jgi:hypothetical protein
VNGNAVNTLSSECPVVAWNIPIGASDATLELATDDIKLAVPANIAGDVGCNEVTLKVYNFHCSAQGGGSLELKRLSLPGEVAKKAGGCAKKGQPAANEEVPCMIVCSAGSNRKKQSSRCCVCIAWCLSRAHRQHCSCVRMS